MSSNSVTALVLGLTSAAAVATVSEVVAVGRRLRERKGHRVWTGPRPQHVSLRVSYDEGPPQILELDPDDPKAAQAVEEVAEVLRDLRTA